MSENTKALEVARAIKAQSLFIEHVKDGPDNFICFHTNDAAMRIQEAIDEATADIRAQLAEAQAQLGAVNTKADWLAEALLNMMQIVQHVRHLDSEENEALRAAGVVLQTYNLHQATRQPNKESE